MLTLFGAPIRGVTGCCRRNFGRFDRYLHRHTRRRHIPRTFRPGVRRTIISGSCPLPPQVLVGSSSVFESFLGSDMNQCYVVEDRRIIFHVERHLGSGHREIPRKGV
jgi:hypothetical protein